MDYAFGRMSKASAMYSRIRSFRVVLSLVHHPQRADFSSASTMAVRHIPLPAAVRERIRKQWPAVFRKIQIASRDPDLWRAEPVC
jgi:hypothetical protein